jgi:ATP-dependent RNA helicase DDX52/ROK1
MDELFKVLSSSARLDKGKRKKKRQRDEERIDEDNDSEIHVHQNEVSTRATPSRDRTGKRDMSESKRETVHKEQIAAFRRSMSIRVTNKQDPNLPDPISKFDELEAPSWWRGKRYNNRVGDDNDASDDDTADDSVDTLAVASFQGISKTIQRNVEAGRWKEPTPIQMQSIPALLERRDLIGAAPTGSGKSGAFILPAILLSGAPYHTYYNSDKTTIDEEKNSPKKKKKINSSKKESKNNNVKQGEIRSLILAPSRELAAQLHREVERLGLGKPGGISSLLLSKSNAAHVIGGTAGGKRGLDVMISTPLRLVDSIEKGLRLDSVRLVVLDEADRLLDAVDGNKNRKNRESPKITLQKDESDSSEDEEEDDAEAVASSSGSDQSHTFLVQMDRILSSIPSTAVRALFSATVTPTVKSLAENILRDPVDLKIASAGSYGGANTDIEQELMFVGREEGKLLAMRQLKLRGHLKPPAIIFVQSQERATALFSELLYEKMHVDVIHAGRSRTARDNAVAKFRKGETWVLIW